MEKSKFNSSVVLLLAIAIFVSCSSEKGLTIEKRQYRKGYSVQWHGKHQKTEVQTASAEPNVTKQEMNEMTALTPVVNSSSASTEPVLVASTAKEVSVPQTKTHLLPTTETKASYSDTKVSAGESQKMAKKYTKADQRNLRKLLKAQEAVGQVDMPMWAYIVFAILLPPLAVGLFEGIHGPFWLSILLTLLFWLPGVIYAIWRVTK